MHQPSSKWRRMQEAWSKDQAMQLWGMWKSGKIWRSMHEARCKGKAMQLWGGCANLARARGVCMRHGAKAKRCSSEGCTNLVRSGGVCVRHGAKVKRCSFEWCTNQAQRGGVCKMHGAKVKLCSSEGCTKWRMPNKARAPYIHSELLFEIKMNVIWMGNDAHSAKGLLISTAFTTLETSVSITYACSSVCTSTSALFLTNVHFSIRDAVTKTIFAQWHTVEVGEWFLYYLSLSILRWTWCMSTECGKQMRSFLGTCHLLEETRIMLSLFSET